MTHEEKIDAMVREYEERAGPSLRERISIALALREIDQTVHRTRARLVEAQLRDTGADASLALLVDLGCDRAIILAALAGFREAACPPRWLGLSSRSDLEAAVNKIRKAQETTDRLQPSMSAFRHIADQWEWLAIFPSLPAILASYAAFLQFHAESEESTPHMEKEVLVAHVTLRTGAPHDKHVATLLATMPGLAGYTTEAHAKWRSRNQHGIESTMRMLEMEHPSR